MKTRPLLSRLRLSRGFSLPEVTIAIGIAALGLTSVIGLLPQGVETLKKAGDVSTETRITQHILASIATADWVNAAGADILTGEFEGRRYYFDDLAVELNASNPGPDVAYVAEVSLPQADISLPASGGSAAADPYLRRVMVKVRNSSSPSVDFKSAPAASYRMYASVVSRSAR